MSRAMQNQAIFNLSQRIGLPIATKRFKRSVLERVFEYGELIPKAEVLPYLRENESRLPELLRAIVPDGFFIADATCTVIIFEIEDTSKLTEEKTRIINQIAWELDVYEWRLFVVVGDRYGVTWSPLDPCIDLAIIGNPKAFEKSSEDQARSEMEVLNETVSEMLVDEEAGRQECNFSPAAAAATKA